MKIVTALLLLAMLSLPLPGVSGQDLSHNEITARSLIYRYISEKAGVGAAHEPYFKSGDFNGDGLLDLAVLFVPHDKPAPAPHIRIQSPWSSNPQGAQPPYRTSLAIFNNHKKGDWLSVPPDIYIFLDDSGVLETPSFEMHVARRSDRDFNKYCDQLPNTANGDLIILPSEAGIDTFVMWDGSNYTLVQPQETP